MSIFLTCCLVVFGLLGFILAASLAWALLHVIWFRVICNHFDIDTSGRLYRTVNAVDDVADWLFSKPIDLADMLIEWCWHRAVALWSGIRGIFTAKKRIDSLEFSLTDHGEQLTSLRRQRHRLLVNDLDLILKRIEALEAEVMKEQHASARPAEGYVDPQFSQRIVVN